MKIPLIVADGNELNCRFTIGNAKHEDQEIKSIRTYIRKIDDAERAKNPEREIPSLSLECSHGNLIKGEPGCIMTTHFTFVWEKFTMGEDEVLIIEFVLDSQIFNYEIAARLINNAKPKEAYDIYLVDPDYN